MNPPPTSLNVDVMRGARIGLIVTPYLSEEVWKTEVIHLEDKPWFHNIHEDDVTELNGKRVTSDDRAAYYYLRHVFGHKVEFVMIDPHDPDAYEKAKAMDLNFLLIFDLLEAFHNEPRKVYDRMQRIFALPNMYPGKDYQRFVNHKNIYYSYFQSKGVPVIPFVHVSMKEYEEDPDAALQKVWGLVVANKYKSIIGKPIFGQEGIDFRIFHAPIKKQRLAAYMERLFRFYKGIIFQPFIKEFSRKDNEIKTIHIGPHRYAINVGQMREMDLQQHPELDEVITRVMEALPPVMVDGIEVPRFITRVDVGQSEGKYFLSEVEFVPSLFSDVYDHTRVPLEKILAEQIMYVSKVYLTKRSLRDIQSLTRSKQQGWNLLIAAHAHHIVPTVLVVAMILMIAYLVAGRSRTRRR